MIVANSKGFVEFVPSSERKLSKAKQAVLLLRMPTIEDLEEARDTFRRVGKKKARGTGKIKAYTIDEALDRAFSIFCGGVENMELSGEAVKFQKRSNGRASPQFCRRFSVAVKQEAVNFIMELGSPTVDDVKN